MIHQNPIFIGFSEALQSKVLHSISPEKTMKSEKEVKIIYKDGSFDSFKITLPHDEFMKEWREFCHWFTRVRNAEIVDEEEKN